MLKTDSISINDQLDDLINKMDSNGQFISIVHKINHVDPISVFASRPDLKGERYYWTSADGQLTFVGLGFSNQLYSSHASDRFTAIESALQSQKHRVFRSTNARITGTGPVYFGGFSFFDDDHKGEWKHFPTNHFVLPKRLVTVTDQGCYLTLNIWIDQSHSVDEVHSIIESEISQIESVESYEEKSMKQVDLKNEMTYQEWEQLINQAIHEIQSTKLDKVVLAREIETYFNQDIPIEKVLKALSEQQERSYIFIMENDDQAFIGATPERLVEVHNNEIQSACLAGTTSRGSSMDEDEWKAIQLLKDEKNLEEHQYVVKMIQEAISPLCDSLRVPNQPMIRKLSKIQHLFTPVTGSLKTNVTIFDALKQLHPTPALGGEPREIAMEFIKQHEPIERGWYAAPIGWFDDELNGEFAVAIRSALITGEKANLFAGCGIVADSEPKAEYEETHLKFSPMLDALGGHNHDNE
ncbi:isochorismate synthase [Alkalibacillus silvisoli]|uniref:Isochorismate synthase MenF n=1 Tax=Alkalibacillus silvisoli TaxID=392823 RepID=A0ABP3JVD6_9BACI